MVTFLLYNQQNADGLNIDYIFSIIKNDIKNITEKSDDNLVWNLYRTFQEILQVKNKADIANHMDLFEQDHRSIFWLSCFLKENFDEYHNEAWYRQAFYFIARQDIDNLNDRICLNIDFICVEFLKLQRYDNVFRWFDLSIKHSKTKLQERQLRKFYQLNRFIEERNIDLSPVIFRWLIKKDVHHQETSYKLIMKFNIDHINLSDFKKPCLGNLQLFARRLYHILLLEPDKLVSIYTSLFTQFSNNQPYKDFIISLMAKISLEYPKTVKDLLEKAQISELQPIIENLDMILKQLNTRTLQPELSPPSYLYSQALMHDKQANREMRRSAQKDSILSQIASVQHISIGEGTINHTGEASSFSQHEISKEVPRMFASDYFGLEIEVKVDRIMKRESNLK